MSYPTEYIIHCKKFNIELIPEYVVCAANRFSDGTIIPSVRHYDLLMRDLIKKLNLKKENVEQGFINQFGVFLSRKEAMQIIKNNKQANFNENYNGFDTSVLYSEGLYHHS